MSIDPAQFKLAGVTVLQRLADIRDLDAEAVGIREGQWERAVRLLGKNSVAVEDVENARLSLIATKIVMHQSEIALLEALTKEPEMAKNTPATCTPAFKVGDHVNHAASHPSCDPSCAFPAGCGTVSSVTPWNTGDGFSYQVKCDKTG